MPPLRQVKPRQIERILIRKGFMIRKTKSSHIAFTHPDGRHTVVPRHNKPVRIGTLMAILRQAEISVEELIKLI